MNWTTRRRVSPAFWLGLAAVATARLLTLPQSLWEWDEILFVRGVEEFDPLHHQPHPPGYPLLIGLGKLLNAVFHDPFASLVALSVISSLIGYVALVWAFRRLARGEGAEDSAAAERIAVGGAVLFHLCPPMLVYGPLALSDSPALMFLSLALAAAAALPQGSGRTAMAFGAFAAAAIGCRPQLALSVLPMMAVALALGSRGQEGRWRVDWRRIGAALGSFTLVCLLWFVPLVVAVGGVEGFLGMMGKQAELFATYDAKVPRAQLEPAFIAFRFIAHPWGQRWTSLPVLALAGVGVGILALARRGLRHRKYGLALPLLVLSGIELALCLLAMSPADGVRYALPSLLGVAFLAAMGAQALASRARVPAAALVPVALLAAGFVVYTAPLLRARATTLSPPAQAALWAQRSLPPGSVLLIDKELAAHGAQLMQSFGRTTTQAGLDRFARTPGTPVYLVGEGASGWPGARTFEWPASDAYGKLTRNLYRVVSITPLPPERRYRAVRGVHDFEPSLRDPRWRWLEPDAAIRLFPVQARAVSLKLGLPAHAPNAAVRVRVSAPGTETALEIPRGQERTAVLPLPGTPVFEIGLRSDRSFIPARSGGSADTRQVAVQLLSVELISR